MRRLIEYAIRNEEKFYLQKRGEKENAPPTGIWTEDIAEAKLYKNPETARRETDILCKFPQIRDSHLEIVALIDDI